MVILVMTIPTVTAVLTVAVTMNKMDAIVMKHILEKLH